MQTKKIKLSQIKVNVDNPRTITTHKFKRLVESLLVFPKMLNIRPVVVDKRMVALGGNMRVKALTSIAEMSASEIKERLLQIEDYSKLPNAEKKATLEYWVAWLDDKSVEVVEASQLTEIEQRQFIIKDNASFGSWDNDLLSAKWGDVKLTDWGLNEWEVPNTSFGSQYTPASPSGGGIEIDANPEEDNSGDDTFGGLPSELQDIDLTPNELPKLEGEDQVAMERIIICYRKEDEEKLSSLIGITKIGKVVYSLDELLGK